MDLNAMLSKLQSMQSEMEKVKNEIAAETVTAESGGGMVSVRMSGNNELQSINISDELMASNDKNMIEDLIVAAVNKAQREAAELAKRKMDSVAGMMPNIPGLNLNL